MATCYALMETSKGIIKIELDEEHAPTTCGNFIGLAEKEFYDGLIFHRYVPGFVIQGGDPKGTGFGGSGKTIPLETTSIFKHDSAGTIAMARSQDPDSASSQFYFTLGPAPHLDGAYAAFGGICEGLDVLDSLRKNDRIVKIRITRE